MKKEKKKIQISTSIFVTMSIVNLVILGLLFSFFKIMIFEDRDDGGMVCSYNNDLDTSDPYITKSINFNKALRGPEKGILAPSVGDIKSDVVIVMYSDILCDYCYEQEGKIKELISKYDGNVRFILKDFPEHKLESISWKSSIAGRCAQAQGLFWDYHDLLYKNNKSLSDSKFIELARVLDLDVKDFNRCVKDEEPIGLVISDIIEARALNIKGVPFIYINNEEIPSDISSEELENMIDVELKIKEVLK